MISEKTYYELLWFKDEPLALDGTLSDRMKDIIKDEYIVPNSLTHKYIESSDEYVVGIPKDWRISDKGLDVLDEFEKEREKTAQAAKEKRNERCFQIFNSLLSATFGAVIALLLSYIF